MMSQDRSTWKWYIEGGEGIKKIIDTRYTEDEMILERDQCFDGIELYLWRSADICFADHLHYQGKFFDLPHRILVDMGDDSLLEYTDELLPPELFQDRLVS